MTALALAVVLAVPRFFVMGDGTLTLVNEHTKERAQVRYRRADGTYDQAALASIRRAFRSKGDESEGKASLRLIEVLSYIQHAAKMKQLTLLSGYRSIEYNDTLRSQGVRAAGGSLHTDGLAADVAFPQPLLRPLWMKVRALDCCGAGYYAKEGFLHIDVGRPRFWQPTTSRVEENLSAGNARLFARTEYDVYAKGEEIVVALHALTVPPVRVARGARVVPEEGQPFGLTIVGQGESCVEVPASGGSVRLNALMKEGKGKVELATCEPRGERTPEWVESNAIEVR